jgi:hypothetical protein
MNQSRKWLSRIVLSAGAVAVLSTPASAGYKSKWPVSINFGTSTVTGSLATARAAKGNSDMIGCEVRAQVINGGQYAVSCRATDSAGASVACWSTNPIFVSVLGGMNGDAILQFTWDSSGQCADLSVTNISWADVKVP